MHTLFISDLHLVETAPERAALFLRFLEERAKRADALYILGDFFDVWVGDDGASFFHQKIIRALKQLTNNGVPVYFMPGNRDFLIGRQFLEKTGCQLLNDPSVIDLYGVSALIMHGDLLCTQDKRYHLFRRIVQNAFVRWLVLLLPLRLRWHLADKARKISQKQNKNKSNGRYIADESVAKILSDYHSDYLIHGHTHQPNIYYFNLNGHKTARAVLGAWEDEGSVLVCQQVAQGDTVLDLKLEWVV